MKNRKEIFIILTILILAVASVMFAYYGINNQLNNNLTTSLPSLESIESNKIEIDVPDDVEETEGGVINATVNSEIQEYISRDKTSILVLAKTGCYYCELYKPVLEKISTDYNLEIIYVDIKNLNTEDYDSFINSEITIPQKCTNRNYDSYLKEGFATPTMLFINKGISYDCIRGYKNEENLINELKNRNIILNE